jgi:hypothetical protein
VVTIRAEHAKVWSYPAFADKARELCIQHRAARYRMRRRGWGPGLTAEHEVRSDCAGCSYAARTSGSTRRECCDGCLDKRPECLERAWPGTATGVVGWMKLDPHEHQIWIHPSRSSKALSRQSSPPPLRRSSRSPRPAPPGFVVWADRRHPEVHPLVCASGKSGVLPTDLPSLRVRLDRRPRGPPGLTH